MRTISEIVEDAEELAQKGDIAQALEVFLDAIDAYQIQNSEMADEMAFQMGWFLFDQHFYQESVEIFKKLQEIGYHKEEIAEIVEEAFIAPNIWEFETAYQKNIVKFKTQIHKREICSFKELPYLFLPIADGVYYLYDKNTKLIGEKITTCRKECSDDYIFNGENAFDTTVFWKDWNYADPVEIKQKNRNQIVCFLSEDNVPFTYLQMPEFEGLFQDAWFLFEKVDIMESFFHNHRELSIPRLYKGIQADTELFRKWIDTEHKFRCSKEGRTNREILLTIGIPSYNRGHRALGNIQHLQKLSYDSEVEFLVCDNCSQENVEGYQEIKRLAERDSRITYYRFPQNPGNNPSPAETVKRASGKFCCLLSDEDLIYLDNLWKYLYLIQRYGDTVGFICAAGEGYYRNNENKQYNKGDIAFDRVFWSLNYTSGLIFHTDLYRKQRLYDLYRWQMEHGENNYFRRGYPHNAAAMRCSLEANIYICGELMFQEGKEDEISESYKDIDGKKVLEFSTVENRLKQLSGVVTLLNEWKNMLSESTRKDCYQKAVGKVFMLIDLIRRQGRVIECSFPQAYYRILITAVEEIQKLDVNLEDREYAEMIVTFSYFYLEYFRLCDKKA